VFAYAATESGKLGSGTFEAFLRESEGVKPLNGLSLAGQAAPGRANTQLMLEERRRLRTLLQAAADAGALAVPCARLNDFLAAGEAPPPTVIDLDEEIEGDSEFMAIVLDE